MELRPKIVFFLGESQYDSMREMTFNLMEAFENIGYDSVSMDLLSPTFIEDLISTISSSPIKFFFGMNGWGSDVTYGEKSLFDTLNIPLFAYYVDPPIYHIDRLKNRISNYMVSFIDKGHLDEVKHIIHSPTFTSTFLPHGTGERGASKKIKERKNELVFAGSIRNPDEIRDRWNVLPIGIRKIMDDVIEESLNSDNRDIVNIFLRILEKNDIYFGNNHLEKLMYLLPQVDLFTRNYRREKIIKSILHLPIQVFGSGWEYMVYNRGSQAAFSPPLRTSEIYEVLGDTKISLNIFPNYANGSHERIFDCMINGSVSFSDKSRYLQNYFKHEESILFYDYKDLNLKENLEAYLDSANLLQNIADKGYMITKEEHTWNSRAKKINELVNTFIYLRDFNNQ